MYINPFKVCGFDPGMQMELVAGNKTKELSQQTKVKQKTTKQKMPASLQVLLININLRYTYLFPAEILFIVWFLPSAVPVFTR